MNQIIFDIETGPLPKDEIIDAMPSFNPDEVKVGNLKDEEKIKAKLADAEQKHREAFFNEAALNPTTGRVLCVGVRIRSWDDPSGPAEETRIIGDKDESEAEILGEFWDLAVTTGVTNELIGFRCKAFDLPFMFKRSWKLGVIPPNHLRNGRYWIQKIIDLYEIWSFDDYRAKGSLDSIAKFLGIPGKTGSGADFARLWLENREAAIAYAIRDVDITTQIYDRFHKTVPNEWA